MKVSKSSGGGGAWLKKAELEDGDILKFVTEAQEIEGQNGKQLVAKCRVKDKTTESMNVAINTPSKNALIDAFGDDTKEWINKHLTVCVLPCIVGGKEGIALYLIPEGYEKTKDNNGYVVIKKIGEEKEKVDTIEYPENDIKPEDIPF